MGVSPAAGIAAGWRPPNGRPWVVAAGGQNSGIFLGGAGKAWSQGLDFRGLAGRMASGGGSANRRGFAMRLTIHALDRFSERFPDCPRSVYESLDQSVPFGGETATTLARIDRENGVIFIVEKLADGDLLVRTVLTEDLYYANTQSLAGPRACRPPVPSGEPAPAVETAPEPSPAEAWAARREARRQAVERREAESREKALAEKRRLEEELVPQWRKWGAEFARDKGHAPWGETLFQEARERYGISRRRLFEYFLPAYHRECREAGALPGLGGLADWAGPEKPPG